MTPLKGVEWIPIQMHRQKGKGSSIMIPFSGDDSLIEQAVTSIKQQ